MKLLNFNKVLCLSPHPDDVEYSMMGTILKHQDTKFVILQLTQGGDCDETTGKQRLNELENVWKEANNSNVELIFTDSTYLKDKGEDEWINYIDNILDKSFDAIFLPNECDSHFEHRFVSKFGKALIRNKSINLIQYYTPSTQDSNWIPNIYIDVEQQYEHKIKCLLKFDSQKDRFYFNNNVLRAFHSDFQCSKKNIQYIEKFKIIDLFIK